MELEETYQAFRDVGAEVLTISTDNEADAVAMMEMFDLTYPVLYDDEESVTKSWGVYNLHGDGLATPATFVIDPGGTLAWGYVGEHAGDRPHADQTLAIVKRLTGPAS